jgi:hypothetical protein
MNVHIVKTSDDLVRAIYSIYEYDVNGLILYINVIDIPLAYEDIENQHPMETESIARFVVEHDGNNTQFENLQLGYDFFDAFDENGVPTSVDISNRPIDIYLHMILTDGDGKDPIGIQNDGIDTLAVSATFRTTEDPASSIITAIDNREWRVTIRSFPYGIYDIVNIKFIQGELSLNYTTTNLPALCKIAEEDFELIEIEEGIMYKINLIGNTRFKVFRQLIV